LTHAAEAEVKDPPRWDGKVIADLTREEVDGASSDPALADTKVLVYAVFLAMQHHAAVRALGERFTVGRPAVQRA
jgi:hypothetical protein